MIVSIMSSKWIVSVDRGETTDSHGTSWSGLLSNKKSEIALPTSLKRHSSFSDQAIHIHSQQNTGLTSLEYCWVLWRVWMSDIRFVKYIVWTFYSITTVLVTIAKRDPNKETQWNPVKTYCKVFVASVWWDKCSLQAQYPQGQLVGFLHSGSAPNVFIFVDCKHGHGQTWTHCHDLVFFCYFPFVTGVSRFAPAWLASAVSC